MAHYWDEFSKSLAEPVERRESLRRLGLAITATVLAPLGIEYASAGHNSRGSSDACRAFCRCQKGKKQNQCVKTCQACDNDPGRLAGTCGSYHCCSSGTLPCGNTCADLAWDPSNCGACGNACTGPDPHCFSGVCSECGAGLAACSNSCVDLSWDTSNCGSCGNACGAPTPNCVYGTCAECTYGLSKCGDSCVDLYFDVNNCGACGNVCSSFCYYGICDYYYGGGGYGGGGYGGYWWGWY